MTDRTMQLVDLWGAPARSLFERLGAVGSLREFGSALDAVLRPRNPPDAAQRGLWRLAGRAGSLDVLISETGLSSRQFRRACLERAGVSPKYLQRILRFRRTADWIRKLARGAAQPSWAQFAVACGYYDQAHFIREFEEFSSVTPVRFLQSLRPAAFVESNHDERTQTREPDRLR
jgi:AraC-like DNA-binding protein